MWRRLGEGPLLALLLLLLAASAAAQGAWKDGRATYYGEPGDKWQIHDGSCTHTYQWPDVGTGWDTGAIDDQNDLFIGSCGRCYEIRCVDRSFKDGYGSTLDRTSACYDPDASVIITVTDACPCSYPGNYYSNKRWCCGDMDHYDLSIWAFEKLADKKWGVIGIQFRPVPCSYKPAKPAPKPKNPTPGVPPPPGAVHP